MNFLTISRCMYVAFAVSFVVVSILLLKDLANGIKVSTLKTPAHSQVSQRVDASLPDREVKVPATAVSNASYPVTMSTVAASYYPQFNR